MGDPYSDENTVYLDCIIIILDVTFGGNWIKDRQYLYYFLQLCIYN